MRIVFVIICFLTALPQSFGGIQEDISALGSSGGTVTIPSGITVVSQTIKVPNNVTLEGSTASSVLKAAAGLNAPVIQNISTSGGNSGMRFIGFKVDGSAGSSSGAGIRLVKCNNVIFKDMQIFDCSDGIDITGNSFDIVVRQCKLYSNGRTGVYVYSGNGIKLDGSGADLHNVVITGCTIYSNYYSGIHCRDMNNLRIYNNYIYDQNQDASDPNSGDDSIKLFRCNHIVAFANRLDESKNNGIEFWGSSYYTAIANNITNSNDGLHGGMSGGPVGNGMAIGNTGSRIGDVNYFGEGYVMLANVCKDNVFTIMQENNDASEGNPNAIIASNISNSNERQGPHHISCINVISTANLNGANGEYDPTEEGTENCGLIMSGCENLNLHANLCYDNRAIRGQMFGLLVRASTYCILSDNLLTDSEIVDLRIESNSSNITNSSNLYHNPVIRFIVSSVASPTGADSAIKVMLEELGYTVNYYDDNNIHPDVITENLILISGTVTSSLIGAAYRNSSVPVLILHPSVMSSMELVDSGGSAASQTNINITNTANYITSFLLSGSTSVASPSSFGYVTGNVIGTKLASINSDTNKSTIVAIEKNALDQLNTAVPERRVFMFLYPNTYNSLSDTGRILFRRGIEYVMGAR
ncbi:MAG: right-handed parallel beta-helix repeat-containing protein [Sedimentisphaerales bacterium]